MEKFIKIFKKELVEIELEIKEDKDYYIIEPLLKYKDFNIHLEFESAGIKKLTELYYYFVSLNDGYIVFIDELDANINDVYLMKLLEYFKEVNKGQLIFTTHNISPMQVLDKNKYGIDFINDNQEITSWKRSGNYSASNLYQEGLIEGLPFNIFPFDFFDVFKKKK